MALIAVPRPSSPARDEVQNDSRGAEGHVLRVADRGDELDRLPLRQRGSVRRVAIETRGGLTGTRCRFEAVLLREHAVGDDDPQRGPRPSAEVAEIDARGAPAEVGRHRRVVLAVGRVEPLAVRGPPSASCARQRTLTRFPSRFPSLGFSSRTVGACFDTRAESSACLELVSERVSSRA